MSQPLFEIVTSPPQASGDSAAPGAIELAVIDSIQDIEASGGLIGKYKAIAVALRATARAVDQGLAAPKISVATSQLTQRLFESLDKLPEPEQDTGSVFDSLDETIRTLTSKALNNEEN